MGSDPNLVVRTRIQLCGRFIVRIDGERLEGAMPGRQGRLVFAYLAVQPNRTATRDRLIEALWPDELPSAPDMALSALLSKLRRLLGDSAITGRTEITLHLPADSWIDLESARNSLHRAESFVIAKRWWDAKGPAFTARYISEREFLRAESAPWIEDIRRELDEIHVRALECNTLLGLALGGVEIPVAAQSARRLIELAPYRESGYRLLMEALEREGNVAEAVLVYERLRNLLRDELGTTPCADVQKVYDRLLTRT